MTLRDSYSFEIKGTLIFHLYGLHSNNEEVGLRSVIYTIRSNQTTIPVSPR